ncbi:hypothetical protein DFP72DRAFT_876255 [Ephemerocybe angulata]|uniref:SET domain-containing protein n=1 Tax=Ephemerocybe angulata TaxID=980116 RepID=A0A8H6IEW2_9AGAR|nr:hypothetical protein DFP72DRAFT_876255 [Tulosesus angulatus]
MKKGFLNSKKARDALDHVPASPSTGSTSTFSTVGDDSEAPALQDLVIETDESIKQSAIITTIPPRGSQTCQMVTIPAMKDFLLRRLRSSDPKISKVKYAVQDTPDMGKGLFATADIAFGETFLVEKPFIVFPKNIGPAFKVSREGIDATSEAWTTVYLKAGEKVLERVLDRLGEEDRDAFNALCDHSIANPKERPILSRMACNAFNLDLQEPPGVQTWGGEYVGVPRIGARINHSCSGANIVEDFDPETFTFSYAASRDIKAGQQIMRYYVTRTLPVAQRRAALSAQQIICTCSACTNATPKTDKLRLEYQARVNILTKACQTSGPLPTAQAQAWLATTLRMKDEMEKEGLDNDPSFMQVWYSLQILYGRLRDEEKEDMCRRRLEGYMEFPGAIRERKKGHPGSRRT